MFDFNNLFSNKSGHPLARESGVTEILAELPAEDPAMALEELTHWLTALTNAEDIKLKERVKRLARIDQSAQKYERALRRQYIESSRMHKTTEERIWNAGFEFLETTINAHLRCIAQLPHKNNHDNHDLAIIVMRTIRRLDIQMHWLHLRYRPLPPSLWERIFSVIKLAEEHSLLQLPITLNSAAQTTVTQEMLKLLMMSVAAPEHLTKIQIDLAHLLTQRLAGTFRWEQIPDGSTVFHVDFSKPKTPVRLTQASEHHFMSRCFGSGEAVRILITSLKQLEQGSVPSALGIIDFSLYKRADLLEVIAHLSQCWSKLQARNAHPHFDKRQTERDQVFYRINVVHDFSALYDQLAQPARPIPSSPPKPSVAGIENIAYQEQVDMHIYGFITEKTRANDRHRQVMQALQEKPVLSVDLIEDETESWVVENISQMGYGVTISSLKEDWVQDNTVIGIQRDAAPWQIGVIRRVASESVENTQAGIQILSNCPGAAMLRPADTEMSVWETAADTQTYHHTPGVLMQQEPPYQDDESVLLASGSYQLHRIYLMVAGEAKRTVRLLDRLNTFQGIDQVIFTDVKSKA